MKAEIITVGDELLLGTTVDTNAAWIGTRLDELGFDLVRRRTVGDHLDLVVEEIESAVDAANLVIVTGGLGPTHDDITRSALAAAFGVELQTDAQILSDLRSLYDRRGRSASEAIETMSMVPEGFEVLSNPIGTAPGLAHVWNDAGPRCLVALPGVPYEMKAIVDRHLEKTVAFMTERRVVRHRTLLTAGVPESYLHARLGRFIGEKKSTARIAFLPDPKKGVRVRLSVGSQTIEEAEQLLERVATEAREILGDVVYGEGGGLLEEVVGARLAELGLTVAVAESCTGGLIADRITDVPGSSRYFRGGLVAYSNTAKNEFLGVHPADLDSDGAVSETVAIQMANGCRARFDVDIAVSATGVAGPDGGTEDKPVGTVWIGLTTREQSRAVKFQFTENRRLNKTLTATAALDQIRKELPD